MRKGSDEQSSKWMPRFTSLQTRLSLFLFFIPTCGLILCSTFEIYRQAAQNVRENTPWLSRLRVLST